MNEEEITFEKILKEEGVWSRQLETACLRHMEELLKKTKQAGESSLRSRIRERVEGMKVKECDCEETIGYHGKDCDFIAMGINKGLSAVITLLDEETNN